MSVHVYFEGGPRDGNVEVVAEAPPEYKIVFTGSFLRDAAAVEQMFKDKPVPKLSQPDTYGMMDQYVVPYFRQYPHEWREGCVTYFWTEKAREAARREAAEEYWRDPEWDGPTGMVEACQPPPTIRASTPL